MGAAFPLSMGYRAWPLLLAALHAADAALTLFCMHRFPNCLEGNPVLAALGGGPRSPWVVAPSMAGVAMLLFIGRRNVTILRIAVYIKAAIVAHSLFLILHPATGSAPPAASSPLFAHPMRRPPPSPFQSPPYRDVLRDPSQASSCL